MKVTSKKTTTTVIGNEPAADVCLMADQHDLIAAILGARKAGDNDTALALVCELNGIAEARGFGDNYWLKLCDSIVKASKLVGN